MRGRWCAPWPWRLRDSASTLDRVIQDVGDALRELIRRDVIAGQNGVDVDFEAPTTDWVARQNSPKIDVYLYDITEDTKRRQVAYEHRVSDDGTVSHAQLPPRRYRLCYLLTAWTQRPEDEHRLLSSLLSCFIQYPTMPRDVMSEAYSAIQYATVMTIALPRPEERQSIEVWTSLGGELKPSLDLVVTVPLFEGTTKEVGPPVFEEPRFTLDDGERSEELNGSGRRRRKAGGGGRGIPPETVYGGVAKPTKKAKPKGAVGDGRGGRVFAVGSPSAPGQRNPSVDDVDDD